MNNKTKQLLKLSVVIREIEQALYNFKTNPTHDTADEAIKILSQSKKEIEKMKHIKNIKLFDEAVNELLTAFYLAKLGRTKRINQLNTSAMNKMKKFEQEVKKDARKYSHQSRR